MRLWEEEKISFDLPYLPFPYFSLVLLSIAAMSHTHAQLFTWTWESLTSAYTSLSATNSATDCVQLSSQHKHVSLLCSGLLWELKTDHLVSRSSFHSEEFSSSYILPPDTQTPFPTNHVPDSPHKCVHAVDGYFSTFILYDVLFKVSSKLKA